MTKNLRSLSLLMLLFGHLLAFGQTKTVTGTVTDGSSSPLPGVAVVVEGTAIGVVTDIDGNYNISIPQDAETLVFSFIGFENQIIEVGGRSVINNDADFRLAADEVVVVGYGTMKRSDLRVLLFL